MSFEVRRKFLWKEALIEEINFLLTTQLFRDQKNQCKNSLVETSWMQREKMPHVDISVREDDVHVECSKSGSDRKIKMT